MTNNGVGARAESRNDVLETVGSHRSTCSNDLEKATEIARQMVERYGMSDRLGFVDVSPPDPVPFGHGAGKPVVHSEDTRKAVDEEIRDITAAAQREAATILTAHRSALETLAAALLDRETLDAVEVADLLSDVPKWRRLHQSAGAIEPAQGDAPTHAAA